MLFYIFSRAVQTLSASLSQALHCAFQLPHANFDLYYDAAECDIS